MTFFDWGEYLALAKELVGTPPATSACCRSATSRAYYSAFHKARRYLSNVKNERIPDDGTAHEVVWSKLERSAKKDERGVGTKGTRLRRQRNKADYDAKEPVSRVHEAQSAITTAERITNMLDRLTPS